MASHMRILYQHYKSHDLTVWQDLIGHNTKTFIEFFCCTLFLVVYMH